MEPGRLFEIKFLADSDVIADLASELANEDGVQSSEPVEEHDPSNLALDLGVVSSVVALIEFPPVQGPIVPRIWNVLRRHKPRKLVLKTPFRSVEIEWHEDITENEIAEVLRSLAAQENPRTLRGVQSDFGGYDSRFVGVTIRLPSARAWRTFALGHDAAAASAAVREGEAESESALFETVAMLSVWQHEVRHFHDSMVAPFGSEVFWRRFFMTWYGLQFMPFLKSEQGEVQHIVPVPITKWLAEDPARRRLLMDRWQAQVERPLRVVDVLNADQGELESDVRKLIGRIAANASALKSFFLEDQESPLRSMHISEASALVVQMAAIGTSFGADRMEFFYRYLVEREGSAYSWALRQAASMAAGTGEDMIDLPTVGTILTWSLLGDVYAEPWKEMPINRSVRLWKHIADHGLPAQSDVMDTTSLFEAWDDALGSSSTLQGVGDALARDEKLLEMVEGTAAETPRESNRAVFWLQTLLPVARMWVAARRQAIHSFLGDPGLHCDPIGYLSRPYGFYPEAPLLYAPEGVTLSQQEFDRIGFSEAGYRVVDTVGDEAAVVTFSESAPGDGVLNFDALYLISKFHTAVDYLFGEFRRDFSVHEETLGEMLLKSYGVWHVEILS